MSYCLKCGADIDDLMNFENLGNDPLVCTSCGHRMELHFSDDYDEETGESNEWFWVEEYKEIQ